MTKNTRFQNAKAAGGLGPKESGATEDLRRHGFSAAAVARLELKWAFGLPYTSSAYGQPTVADGRVFIGSDSGYLYSLDAATGCVHWSFQAQAGLRSTPMLGPAKRGSNQFAAFFGDIRGNAYAVDASTGKLLWKTRVDPHPLARITAGVTVHEGRVYVAVASLEEPESASFNYKCCTIRGLVAVLDASTGKEIWKTYTLPEEPSERKTNGGITFLGPSGAGIWGPITIDPKRQAVYVSTGNAFSAPDLGRSNAVMAMDINTGRVLWVMQAMHGDVWHTGCPQGPSASGHPPRSAHRRPGPPPPSRGTRHAAGPTTTTVRMKQTIRIGTSRRARSSSTFRTDDRWSSRARNRALCGHSTPTTKAR
jgi:polyvinyl alcohol dehydrogenase (cytochrome)